MVSSREIAGEFHLLLVLIENPRLYPYKPGKMVGLWPLLTALF